MKKREVEIVMWNWKKILDIIIGLLLLFITNYFVILACIYGKVTGFFLAIIIILLISLNWVTIEYIKFSLPDVKKVYKVVGKEINEV